jgi:hypothetical protein
LLLFLKKFLSSTNEGESLTKKLMNYISNESKDLKKDYNTFNNNDDIINVGFNNCGKPGSNRAKETNALLNNIENENNDKLNKIIRFAVDYCRASPNITLNNKNMLNIGWRIQKFNYDVNYEIEDYKGQKTYVI